MSEWLTPYHDYTRPPPSAVLAEAAKITEQKTGHTLKGAHQVHFFFLDDDLTGNSGSLRVIARQSQFVVPRELTVDATRHALRLPREQRFTLRKLDPDAVYLLSVRDDAAELREGTGGRAHHVLCEELRETPPRQALRLLESGKRTQLTGADTLRCTFPDSRVEDNSGALEVGITDITSMSRQERAAALRAPLR